MKTFKYKVISTQSWNNDNTQLISEHKTLLAAEKQLSISNKGSKKSGNIYHIEEIK